MAGYFRPCVGRWDFPSVMKVLVDRGEGIPSGLHPLPIILHSEWRQYKRRIGRRSLPTSVSGEGTLFSASHQLSGSAGNSRPVAGFCAHTRCWQHRRNLHRSAGNHCFPFHLGCQLICQEISRWRQEDDNGKKYNYGNKMGSTPGRRPGSGVFLDLVGRHFIVQPFTIFLDLSYDIKEIAHKLITCMDSIMTSSTLFFILS